MLRHILLILTCFSCCCDHHQDTKWTDFACWVLINFICSVSMH